MLAEEERLENAAALENLEKSGAVLSSSTRVQGDKDLDSDATIAGFVLQQHLASILGFLCHQTPSTRFAAVELVGTLLRQGMLCPLDVIGYLIALQGDNVFEVRR